HLPTSNHSPGDAALTVGLTARLEQLRLGVNRGDLVPVGETLGQAHRRASLTSLLARGATVSARSGLPLRRGFRVRLERGWAWWEPEFSRVNHLASDPHG